MTADPQLHHLTKDDLSEIKFDREFDALNYGLARLQSTNQITPYSIINATTNRKADCSIA